MQVIGAFFRLIRWPNVLFIALSQLLFYWCIIIPLLPAEYASFPHALTPVLLSLLITASSLIAAAGYIINDYFDINIDRVNKPGKMVIEKVISRRTGILLHFILTTIGVSMSLYVAWHTNLIIAFANIGCSLLLWFYSTSFKKKLLIGNVIISLLTAWTIIVLYVAVHNFYMHNLLASASLLEAIKRIYKFGVLYAGFAFVISLIREVVKDLEDMEGDSRYGCETMPIVWGVPAAKIFIGVWLVVLVSAIVIVQFYVLHFGWWWSAVYSLLFLILPLILIFRQIYFARGSKEYNTVSSNIKWVMLMGILSMLLIRVYL